MLTPEEKSEIEAESSRYERKRSAVIEALKAIQRRRGWVSDEAVRDVAGILEMTPAEVDGVATFYSLVFRRPVGRHVILICDSVSCWTMGYDAIREHLKAKLRVGFGETSADGRFTLLPASCLGACDLAPAMMIDEDLYGNLTPPKVDEILAKYS
jgi:NADH-quinone oxidoreductase subunit E